MTDKTVTQGRRTFLLLAALFFGPLIGAWIYFFTVEPGSFDTTVNKGELIDPPIPVSVNVNVDLNSYEDEDLVRRAWTLVFVAPGNCDSNCQEALFKLRQIRLSLGRRMERVSGLLLTTSTPSEAFNDVLAEQHNGLTQLPVNDAERIRDALQGLYGAQVELLNQFYIIDPLGNLMMMYPPSVDPSDVMHDLKRLLKVSRVG